MTRTTRLGAITALVLRWAACGTSADELAHEPSNADTGSDGTQPIAGTGAHNAGGGNESVAGSVGLPPSSSACVVTRGGGASGPNEDTYARLNYDAAKRVLTVEHSSAADFSNVVLLQRILYDEAGRQRVLAAEDLFNDSSWRFDSAYDAHGNQTENLATYTDELDFDVVPPPPHYSLRRVSHTYDAAGLLTASSTTEVQPGFPNETWTFTHDVTQRCASLTIDTDQSTHLVDTRGYGDRSLLSEVEGRQLDRAEKTATTFRYDDDGRILSMDRDGDGRSMRPVDGSADVTRRYTYAEDGSIEIDLLDFTTDRPNGTAQHDGMDAPVRHYRWSLSPACALITAELPKKADVGCSIRPAIPLSICPRSTSEPERKGATNIVLLSNPQDMNRT